VWVACDRAARSLASRADMRNQLSSLHRTWSRRRDPSDPEPLRVCGWSVQGAALASQQESTAKSSHNRGKLHSFVGSRKEDKVCYECLGRGHVSTDCSIPDEHTSVVKRILSWFLEDAPPDLVKSSLVSFYMNGGTNFGKDEEKVREYLDTAFAKAAGGTDGSDCYTCLSSKASCKTGLAASSVSPADQLVKARKAKKALESMCAGPTGVRRHSCLNALCDTGNPSALGGKVWLMSAQV
jgi:hypothetical protein